MKALLDTCIVVDLLQKREPFFKDAKDIFLCVANHRFEGFVSAKALTDIYYLMHRYTHSDAESRKALDTLLKLVGVLPTSGVDCQKALLSEVTDYEDAVMIETAIREQMDCIVTRNLSDYAKSSIPVYAPDAFLALLLENEE